MNIRKFFVVGIFALAVCGCQQFATYILHDPGAFTSGWAIDSWTKNVTLHVTGNTFNFDFPNQDGIHMISKKINGIAAGSTVSITYEITGKSPIFTASGETLGGAPTVGFIIGSGRIYSNNVGLGEGRAPLALGRHTITVPLTPDRWQDVSGFPCNYDQIHIDSFNRQLQGANYIGICFGDNQGFAHGANLTTNGGSAHFNCLSFTP